MKRIIALTVTLVATGVLGGDYYAAPGGNDSNPGSNGKPFATIQAGVNKLQPGDTLLIRGGMYRETVTFPRSGSAGKPITLKSYRNEKVMVSGCDPVSGWTKYKDNIWKAPMAWTLGTGRNQVFCGGQIMIEARYPNVPAPGLEMYVGGLSPLWPTFGEFSIPKETRVSQPGRIVCKLFENQPENYWKGALYQGVHFEGWCEQTGVIESSKPGEISVGDRTQGWWFGPAYDGKFPQEHEDGRGMIVGHMNALDVPREWHWQENVLYLIAPDGAEPRVVEAKRRQLAFDLSGREHIHIEGIEVRAASMRLENSACCVVDRCTLEYISHFTRQYNSGQVERGRDTIKSGETGIFLGGHDNCFLNCSVRFSAGAGFHLRGYHNTIHNCLIDEVSYTAHYLNAITDAVSDFGDYENFLVGGHVITFNTMRNAGRHFFNFYGNGPSLSSRDRGPMDYAATLFAHNHLYNGMMLTRDAGFLTGFFSSGGTLNGQHSQVAYNVMHDCYDISAMRWNKLGMVYLDNGTREVDVHHNLLWAEPGSLQSGIWFNPPNINVSDHDNVFHGLFTRTCAELRADDFPGGKPFRFGHDFGNPPSLPKWPQLETEALDAGRCTAQSEGVVKNNEGISGLKNGDWFCLGTVDFNKNWQSAVMRFASDQKAMNSDRSTRKSPRHHNATDPLVFDTKDEDGHEGVKSNWHVLRGSNKGWICFKQAPLGDGYRRVRVVYGTVEKGPRQIEVRLDKPDGLLAGQASLHATDKPRQGSVQMFEEAVGELSAEAKGTRDLYFVFAAGDGKPVAEVEYFRFERSRSEVALQKNDVRFELRAGSRDGELIGQFFPRATGGVDEFRDLVATLEPAQGVQPLYVVVRSELPGALGVVGGISLQKAGRHVEGDGLGVPPLRRLGFGRMILPEATNLPCSGPAARYREATANRPFIRVPKLAVKPVIDGVANEWKGAQIELKQSLEGAVVEGSPAHAWIGSDDDALYVGIKSPVGAGKHTVSSGQRWDESDGVEIALQNGEANPPGPIFSLHGSADGKFSVPDQAGLSADAGKRLAGAVSYRVAEGQGDWTCEWRIPFAAIGGMPGTLLCNFTVRNVAEDTWRTWHTAGGSTYDLHNGGTLVLGDGRSLLSDSLKKSLEVWLDAADVSTVEKDGDGKVSAWKDKSGKGRNAVQADAGFWPLFNPKGLNGKASLQFDDGRKTRLELPDLSDRPVTAMVFAVISNPDSGKGSNQYQRIFTASDGKEADYKCGLACNINGAETGGPRQVTIEGKDRWAKSVRVGCFSPACQTFFNGYISEILVFGRTLTAEERMKVTAYLMAKWDL